MGYKFKFFDNLNQVREAYASLPYCFAALKEYYGTRANNIQQFMTEAMEYQPNQRSRSFANELISYVDSITGDTVCVSKQILATCLQASDDTEAGDISINKVYDSSQITKKASEVVDDLMENYVESSSYESFYQQLSESVLTEKPKVEEFISKIQVKFGELQLPSKAQTFVEVLRNSNTPADAFYAMNQAEEPVDLTFNFDDFSTSFNAFDAAIIEIGQDIVSILAKAYEGVKKIKDFIAATKVAIGTFCKWILKKTAGQLFVDYTYDEKGDDVLDVPIFSGQFDSLADMCDCLIESGSSYSTLCSIYNNVYGATILQVGEVLKTPIYDLLHSTVDQTGVFELPIPSGIIRIFKYQDKYHIYLYCTGYRFSYNNDNSLFEKSPELLNLDTTSNASFGSLIDISMCRCLGSLLSLPGCSSAGYLYNKTYYTASPLLTTVINSYINTTTWNSSHRTANDLIDSLVYKDEDASSYGFNSVFMDTVRCMLIHIGFAIAFKNLPLEGWSYIMNIRPNTSDPTYDLTGITPSNNVYFGFYPYYTSNSAKTNIHVQTDAERLQEVKTAIVATIIAIAAIYISVKLIKLRIKWSKLSHAQDVTAWEAWDSVAKWTHDSPYSRDYLLNVAYKAQRKADRYNKIYRLFGFTNVATAKYTYDTTYGKDSKNAQLDLVLKRIG